MKNKRREVALQASPEPYPDFPLPTPEQCRAVRDDLLALHGFPEVFAPYRPLVAGAAEPSRSVLDGLVSVLLSQNTTDANSRRAFASLKSAFPTWEEVFNAEKRSVENAIRCGGLAATKAARIKCIVRDLMERRGEICLEYLRSLTMAEVKAELSQFKGIGPKTVACVLMFYLQQEDFPVDTHVFRITKAIGWVPIKANREKAYAHLNKRIPTDLKFDLNCLFVTHGKVCPRCAKKGGNEPSRSFNASYPLTSYTCPLEYKTTANSSAS
ncbi:Protein ROS1 [Apostasia shenzhenica]|uniref:Protein ROS1 n=1 Tax=Apostasia shenzhenica TaxID=1088818 RepID=A0A2I0AQT6_9ASPA|nr:Protein ROS1 [Apostasia shenzhenica]